MLNRLGPSFFESVINMSEVDVFIVKFDGLFRRIQGLGHQAYRLYLRQLQKRSDKCKFAEIHRTGTGWTVTLPDARKQEVETSALAAIMRELPDCILLLKE